MNGFKKEKEAKENIMIIFLIGIFLFSFGASMSVITGIETLLFYRLFSLFGFATGCFIFLMGLGVMAYAVSCNNSIIRKIPERC